MTPILSTLNQFPPFIAMALAKVRTETGGWRGLTVGEMVGGTGMSKNTVMRTLARPNWNGVTVENASDFLMVCEVDPFSKQTLRRLQRTVTRKKPLAHLNRRQRRAFERRLKKAGWL